MRIDVDNEIIEIDDKLVEKYNQCMQRCIKQKYKTIFISNPSCRSKFYDILKVIKRLKMTAKQYEQKHNLGYNNAT